MDRSTAAILTFDRGAIGELFHSVVLGGARFSSEFELFADELHIVISDLYHIPRLKFRKNRKEDYIEVCSSRTMLAWCPD